MPWQGRNRDGLIDALSDCQAPHFEAFHQGHLRGQ
jgi:hypothetical protein